MINFSDITQEVLISGTAASFACIFTNPLELVKIRMQLQGELKSKGTYSIIYKNFLTSFYTIWKSDGVIALQRGLITAMLYQFMMHGTRLIPYTILTLQGFHLNEDGDDSFARILLMSSTSGAFGAVVGSPLFLVKTHQQIYSSSSISVGYQRKRMSLKQSIFNIYNDHGFIGLWRGWQAQVIRSMTGSSIHLSTISKCQELLRDYEICEMNTTLNTTLASVISGAGVTIALTPFDNLSTRIYNQPLDKMGKGLYYSGVIEAFNKVIAKEGYFALYKGMTGVFIRLTCHTLIMVHSWDHFRQFYSKWK